MSNGISKMFSDNYPQETYDQFNVSPVYGALYGPSVIPAIPYGASPSYEFDKTPNPSQFGVGNVGDNWFKYIEEQDPSLAARLDSPASKYNWFNSFEYPAMTDKEFIEESLKIPRYHFSDPEYNENNYAKEYLLRNLIEQYEQGNFGENTSYVQPRGPWQEGWSTSKGHHDTIKKKEQKSSTPKTFEEALKNSPRSTSTIYVPNSPGEPLYGYPNYMPELAWFHAHPEASTM